MYHCLRNSLTDEAANNILSERENYHINQEPSGPLLFKLLVQKAVVDVRATATLLRTNLTELVKYMDLVNCDISKFNQYVNLNHEGLHARGDSCPDLMIHLFNAYLSVKDKQFKTYMNLKKIAYGDGTNFTPEQLMSLALGQYTIITEEEQVVALSARFEKLKDANLKLSKAIKDKSKSKRRELSQQAKVERHNQRKTRRITTTSTLGNKSSLSRDNHIRRLLKESNIIGVHGTTRGQYMTRMVRDQNIDAD